MCKHRWSDTAMACYAWVCLNVVLYGTFVCATFVGQTKAKYEAFMEANLCSIKIFQGTLVYIMLGVHYGSCYGWLYPAMVHSGTLKYAMPGICPGYNWVLWCTPGLCQVNNWMLCCTPGLCPAPLSARSRFRLSAAAGM